MPGGGPWGGGAGEEVLGGVQRGVQGRPLVALVVLQAGLLLPWPAGPGEGQSGDNTSHHLSSPYLTWPHLTSPGEEEKDD